MRLIDADALEKRRIDWLVDGYADSPSDMKEWGMAIIEAPTIDAVEVVRCKDCRWYRTAEGCFFSTAEVEPDGFCSYGDTVRNGEREGE